jgi:hypothetical protein
MHCFFNQGVSLVIGQSYIDNASKSFDPEKAFTGVITRFNVWNYELDDDEVNKISLVCGEEEGVIIAWPEVKLWTFDGLEVIERDDCFPGRYTRHFAFQLQCRIFVGASAV